MSKWVKYKNNPVLGGRYGTCFDISVLKCGPVYRMYFSWRPKKSIALTESADGISWSKPEIILSPKETKEHWEDDLNRPVVLRRGGRYYMWYTGQDIPGAPEGKSWLFMAGSEDGVSWERKSGAPVLTAEEGWEKAAVMNPHVLWDEEEQLFKLWYSAGEQYEPNAIGYAESKDGFKWKKHPSNPIFTADTERAWERHKVAGCQVIRENGRYIMFYIGYRDEHFAQIGIARSNDGVTGWERYAENPIIAPDPGNWDGEACYKPYTLFDGQKWLLWYNGRTGTAEQIGLAFHEGRDFGFA